MVYVTGDLHGDKERLLSPRMKKLKKNDVLLVCGDFGFVWDGSKEENRLLKWISNRPYKLLFVEGTHENFGLLAEYPEEELFEGRVRRLGKNLYQMLKGQVFTIEGKRFFAFGGGDLSGSEDHVEGLNWRVGEHATDDEVAEARGNLDKTNWSVDYIITHDATSKVRGFLNVEDDQFTLLETFLDEVGQNCSFNRWFFGNYHLDRVVSPLYTAVFKSVIALDK